MQKRLYFLIVIGAALALISVAGGCGKSHKSDRTATTPTGTVTNPNGTGTGPTGTGTASNTGTGTFTLPTGTGTGSGTGTGTGGTGTGTGTGGGSKPNEFYCASGQYASGHVDGGTKYDGDVFQDGSKGIYGYFKVDLSGVDTSARVAWVRVHINCIMHQAPKGGMNFSDVDPQSSATNLRIGEVHAGYAMYASGWMTINTALEARDRLNAAIASGQGFITVIFAEC
ncbi:MAG: hypothetical protein ACYS8W_13790 [Planctomycetota bacterium]|jgi:hypothetical protein